MGRPGFYESKVPLVQPGAATRESAPSSQHLMFAVAAVTLAILAILAGAAILRGQSGASMRHMSLDAEVSPWAVTLGNRDEGILYGRCRATVDGRWVSEPLDIGDGYHYWRSAREVTLLLANFTRGGARFDAEHRIPRHLEVVCERFRNVGAEVAAARAALKQAEKAEQAAIMSNDLSPSAAQDVLNARIAEDSAELADDADPRWVAAPSRFKGGLQDK